MFKYILICILCYSVFSLVYKFFKPKIKGKIGEKKVSSFLKRQEGILFDDICFKTSYNRSCQIDHILLTTKGIFVIETKNYAGVINASENWDDWYHFVHNQRYNIYSPFKQNAYHIKALKEILGYDLLYENYVIFTDPFCKLNTESKRICKFNQFKKIFKTLKKQNDVYSLTELEKISDILKDYLNENSVSLNEHISYVNKVKKIKRA